MPRHSMVLRLTATTWLMALLVAGCGGGGSGGGSAGSGSGPGGSGSVGSPAGAVTVGAPTPAKVSATKVVGDTMDSVKLTGAVTGDVESLQNKSVTVMIEDPSQLFQGTGYLTLVRTATGFSYELDLPANQLKTSGHLAGNLRVFACLDTACKQPLAGTPLTVPYDVTVEEGLALSRQDVTVTVPFGTVPPPEIVTVGWSQTFGKGYIINNTTPYNPYVPTYVSFDQSAGTLLTAPQLQLKPQAAPPGAYTELVEVRSNPTLADGRTPSFVKTITVHYNVTPNPGLDYVTFPAGPIELTHSASDRAVRYYNHRLVLNTGVTAAYLGVDYLSAAGTTGPAASWWDEYPYNGSYHSCVGDLCLTPGVYTAQIRYRLTTPTGTRDIAVPLKLTVTP